MHNGVHLMPPMLGNSHHDSIQVQWMKSEFDMSSCKHRALFLFAVSNLNRWLTLASQKLPQLASKMVYLKPWERNEHVKITLQSDGR